MPTGKLIFSQLTEWIHPEQFRRCVTRYDGNRKVYNFPCWDQFLTMAFAQLTNRDSLADIEVCLRSRQDQLYRLGFRSTVAHSTLADANRSRDWRIYHDLPFSSSCCAWLAKASAKSTRDCAVLTCSSARRAARYCETTSSVCSRMDCSSCRAASFEARDACTLRHRVRSKIGVENSGPASKT